jgi:hypothetical protein
MAEAAIFADSRESVSHEAVSHEAVSHEAVSHEAGDYLLAQSEGVANPVRAAPAWRLHDLKVYTLRSWMSLTV